MLPKNAKIFASFHPDDKDLVLSALTQIKAAGWNNIIIPNKDGHTESVSELIEQSEMTLIFLSKTYAQAERLMLEEFAYASVVVRKPFLPVWLDTLADIKNASPNSNQDRQLLSALEMLTAKHSGTTTDNLAAALGQFTPDTPPYTSSTPQICEKPCEAYEGSEPYLFISYAHDDAKRVYPIVKELYESGWDLWYDEGIKTTERYMPVIADHVHRCAVFVLMLTNRCLERPFVMNYELEYARQRGIPIIPVLLEKLAPPPYAKDSVALLLRTAIAPESLLERVSAEKLPNHGARAAVPPAVKQNVVYDVVPPPKLPGFEIGVVEGEIFIAKYVGNATDIVVPATVEMFDGKMNFKITRIGKRAFIYCTSLTSITLSENITSIGDFAFHFCTSLTSIILPKSITSIGKYIFDGCNSLASIIIPERVTSIDNYAFRCCASLRHVVISENVKYIAENAFYGCPVHIAGRGSRKDIVNDTTRPPETKQYQKKNSKPLSLPELPCCEEIPYALVCCAKEDVNVIRRMLTALYWEGFNIRYEETPNQQTIIESACVLAFFTKHTAHSIEAMGILRHIAKQDTSRIIQLFPGERIDLPDEIKYDLQSQQGIIQNDYTELDFRGRIKKSLRAFNCHINHPRGFEIVDKNASIEIVNFQPTGFSHVIIPATFFNPEKPVTSIGEEAFYKCVSLVSITLPKGVTSIGPWAFYECESLINIILSERIDRIGMGAFRSCTSLVSIALPKRTTPFIDECAFHNCTSLTSVTLPKRLTSIPDFAFTHCISLASISLPTHLIRIGKCAFGYCVSLISIIIPRRVTCIGEDAFLNCTSLTSITIPKTVTSIGDNAFEGCISLVIYCPLGSEAWRYAEEHGIKHGELSERKAHPKESGDMNSRE